MLLAARKRARNLLAALLQARKPLEYHLKIGSNGVCAVPACICAKRQILLHGKLGEYAPPLGNLRKAKADDPVRLHMADGLATKRNLALFGPQQTGDGVQRGGFTRAVRADERNDLALVHLERNALDGIDRAVIYNKILYGKHHAHYASPPKYAATTFGFVRTASGSPSVITRP